MRVAYFSPLPPQESGIADYSVELLPYLAAHADIDLWVPGGQPVDEALRAFPIVGYGEGRAALRRLADYESVVYHLGNDVRYHRRIYEACLEHPGVVVLHDVGLHHFMAGYFLDVRRSPKGYVDEMAYNYGAGGRSLARKVLAGKQAPLWETDPLRYPLNRRILDVARGVIVHSEFARRLVRRTHPDLPVATIPHHARVLDDGPDPALVRSTHGLPPGHHLVASFGHATRTKRIDVVLRALATLARRDLRYVIVGDASPEILRQIAGLGLEGVVRVMGRVDLPTFVDCMRIADVCVNLRHPTLGETSGAACRALGAGRPCVVSNVGWFAELPGDCVAKVDVDDTEHELLVAYLGALLDDERLRAAMGDNARRYIATHHAPEAVARRYVDFLRALSPSGHDGSGAERWIADVAGRMADVGITEHDRGFIEAVGRELAPLLPPRSRDTV